MLVPPPPPQATSAARRTHNKTSQPERRCGFRGLAPKSKKPASGMKAAYTGEACQNPPGFLRDAELAGTLTASAKDTGLLLGVMVGGVKVHVAPAGNELCKHDSVIA